MSPEDAQEPTFEDTTPVKTSPVLETERKLARSSEMPPPVSEPHADEGFDEFADTVFEAEQPTVDGFHAASAQPAHADEASEQAAEAEAAEAEAAEAEAAEAEAAEAEKDEDEGEKSAGSPPLAARAAAKDVQSRRKPTLPPALTANQGELDDELPSSSNKMLAVIVAGVVLAMAALVYFGLLS